MFQQLSDRLNNTFKALKSKGRLSETDISDTVKEIRTALLDADVALSVANSFSEKIREKSLGIEVSQSLNPAQQVIKIVHQELVNILGGDARRLTFAKNPPTVIMLLGLQGAGKTTLAGKLAKYLARDGHTPLLVAADLQRPNAVDQLKIVASQAGVQVFAPEPGNGVGDPVKVAKEAMKVAQKNLHDMVIIDTAGRLAIDDELTKQAQSIRKAVDPQETLLVIDSMIGQDSVVIAQNFMDKVGFDGIVLTKLDGDARGGAALSLREITGKPVMFASNGEKLDDFDIFYPDRLANRLLDMGDVLTLIEQAERVFDQGQKDRFEAKLASGESFTLDDFLEQLQSIKKMGSMSKMLGMLPGMQQAKKQIENFDDREVTRIEAIIQSMKPEERQNPKGIDAARKIKIAQGAGCEVKDINSLINRFSEAQKMMKRAQAGGGIPGMGGQTFVKQKQKQKPGKGAKRSGNPAKRALQEQGIKLPEENEMGSGFNLS
jgi:signal recognition particle subunit SRP54